MRNAIKFFTIVHILIRPQSYSSSPNFRRITLQNFMGVNYVRSVWLKAVLT
jgi:hypothetical protein